MTQTILWHPLNFFPIMTLTSIQNTFITIVELVYAIYIQCIYTIYNVYHFINAFFLTAFIYFTLLYDNVYM